jgi:phage-related baseplate assembly protein
MDGDPVEEYHLYVSTAEMPAEVPPAEVSVTYVDADNPSNVLYSTTFTAYYNTDNVVTVDAGHVPEGYTLQGSDGAYITVDAYGQAAPSSVTFYFTKPQPVKGTVTVFYTDTDGNEIASRRKPARMIRARIPSRPT